MSKIFLILLILAFSRQFVFSADSKESSSKESSSKESSSQESTEVATQNSNGNSGASSGGGSIITLPFRLPFAIIRNVFGFIGPLLYGIFSNLARLFRLIFGSLFMGFSAASDNIANNIAGSGGASASSQSR